MRVAHAEAEAAARMRADAEAAEKAAAEEREKARADAERLQLLRAQVRLLLSCDSGVEAPLHAAAWVLGP